MAASPTSTQSFQIRHLSASKMLKLNKLREFLSERLTAAALEILGAVEETFADYHEEICRSKEEIVRLRRLLELVTQPEIKLHRIDPKRASGPEPPHIEEPQEEGGGQGGEQQPREESDTDTVHSDSKDTSPTANNDLSLSLHLYQTQTDGNCEGGYSLVIPMNVVKTEPEGEACGSAGLPSDSVPFSVAVFNPENKSGRIKILSDSKPLHPQTTFPKKSQSSHGHTDFLNTSGRKLKGSLGVQTSGKRQHPCIACKKHFRSALTLQRHRLTRRCKLCDKCFPYKSCLDIHMRGHIGERPFQCIECSKGFKQRAHLVSHMRTHTRQQNLKPYPCKEQGKGQGYRTGLVYHIGTLEKDNQCQDEASDIATGN